MSRYANQNPELEDFSSAAIADALTERYDSED